MLSIRKSTASDLPAMLDLYADARAYMAENGNPTQWGKTNPPVDSVDIIRKVADDISSRMSVEIPNGESCELFENLLSHFVYYFLAQLYHYDGKNV